MLRSLPLALVFACILSAKAGAAQPDAMMDHMAHAMPKAPDTRALLHFPPPMQAHLLGNMRDHMITLNGILQAMAAGDYAAASKLAADRLGLDSPAAASCKPQTMSKPMPQMSKATMSMDAPDSMDLMMAHHMPEGMRTIGYAMHSAASDFATAAAGAVTSHDGAAALKALAAVTQNCVACHAAYRLR